MATKQTVERVWSKLWACYPEHKRKGFTAETVANYVELLADIPDQFLEAAALDHITEDEWFPTIASLRRRAFDLNVGEQPQTPGEAWALVMKECKRSAFGREPMELPESVQSALDAIGGPKAIGQSDSTGLNVLQSHFVKAYATLCERAARDRRMLPEVREVVRGLAAGEARGLIEAGEK